MKQMTASARKLCGSMLCACMIACAALFMTSCDKDAIGDETLLYGRWEMVDFEGFEKEGGELVDEWDFDPAVDAGDYVIFHSDHTYVEGSGANTGDSGTWRIKGNKLYVTCEGETVGATISTLTASSLVFEVHYRESGYEYYERSSFRKVEE